MRLIQQLQDDMKTALKGGDVFALGVLRMVIAAIQNKEIEKRGKKLSEELTDDEARDVLSKEMKKRHDAIALYEQGGRADLAEQENKEAQFIQKYLPAQMSEEEIKKVIDSIVSTSLVDNFGEAMKRAMQELKGRADGKIVADIIKNKLTKKSI